MTKAWNPSKEFITTTRLYQWMKKLGFDEYDSFYQKSISDLEWFWEEAEKELEIQWNEKYKKIFDDSKGVEWTEWFVGGKVNAVHLSVERWAHDVTMQHEQALIWEGEDGVQKEYSFLQLSTLVDKAAGGLKQLGVKQGDVVALYMPMLSETVIAMMALAKLGAISAPIFSGYGADAISVRIQAANVKTVITANGFLRRGRQVPMKAELDKALQSCPQVEHVVVVNRVALQTKAYKRDTSWDELMQQTPLRTTEETGSSDPLMLLYTSGTTGSPKGTVHTHGGFPVKAAFDAGICMDVKKRDRVFWFTDMGWMMGPFLVYGGLVNGAAIVLYEGTPDYPNADRLWQLVEQHNVTHLGISPTLVRSLMKHGESWTHKFQMAHLRIIASTGEPWNDGPWMWLFDHVGKKRTPIINYSGGTEISGGILSNLLIRPIGIGTFNAAVPGMAADVFDDAGKSVRNEVGELVIKKPWVGMTNGFWDEPKRYVDSYWGRFKGSWVHGDWVICDEEGYWTITGRSDDILNVAGKRLGPSEMETVLVNHPTVHEAGVIGIPDDLKGEAAVCFVVLKKAEDANDQTKEALLSFVAEKMGKALRPKTIHFISDLPKTRNGKVMRRLMKSAYLGKNLGDLSALEHPQLLKEIHHLAGGK
ncbi:AMP-binding protein [bacterium LRH843]|nr:AMP-binding protein [bacterium LRH843]